MTLDLMVILSGLASLAGSIFVSVVVFLIQRRLTADQKKKEEAERVRHDSKTQLELLHLQLVNAGNSLSYAVAMAVKRGTPNGEIEAGIEKYKKAKKAYFDYLTMIGITHFEQEDDI